MEEKEPASFDAISNLYSLVKILFEADIDSKPKKGDKIIHQFKEIIKLSVSTLFSYVNDDKKEAEKGFEIIEVILSSLKTRKLTSVSSYISKFYYKESCYLLSNMCYNMHYTKSFKLIEKLAKSQYVNNKKHKEIIHFCFLTLLTLLITMRGTKTFLGDNISYEEISDFIKNSIKTSEFLKEFCTDKDKYVGRLATEYGKLEIQKKMIDILKETFDDESLLQIYKDQKVSIPSIRGEMFVNLSYLVDLQKNVMLLVKVAAGTPFDIIYSNGDKKNKQLFPANPPFAFEREIKNEMGVFISSLCKYEHKYFVPFNSHSCSPIVSLPEKCQFCESNKYLNDFQTNYIHSFEVPMYYKEPCDPYKTNYLQEVGPMGPIETHVLRAIFLTCELIANQERKDFYIGQLNTVIRCIAVMLFPFVSFEQSFTAAATFLTDTIGRLVPFIDCLEKSSSTKAISFESNVYTFRSLFAEAMSHVMLASYENLFDDSSKEKLWDKKSQKIIRPTTLNHLLRKFLLIPSMRSDYPLCYHFLRLCSSMNNYQTIIPYVKDIDSLHTIETFKDLSKIDWSKLIKIRENDLLTNEMRLQINDERITFLPIHYSSWVLPELLIPFISSYNEFISVVDKKTHSASHPDSLKSGTFNGIDTEEIMNVIIESSFEHLCTDYSINITSETEKSLLCYLKRQSLSFISLDFLSCGAFVTSGAMTPKLLFQNKFEAKDLDAQQSFFINQSVISTGRGPGLKMLAEKLMSETHDKEDLEMNIVDYMNHKSKPPDGLTLNEIESDAYDAFLNAKSKCARIFTVNQLPSIVDLISLGKCAFGGSLAMLIGSSFFSHVRREPEQNEIPEIPPEMQKDSHIKQIQEVALLLITYTMKEIAKDKIKTTTISDVLSKIRIPSSDSQGYQFFQNISSKPIALAAEFLNDNYHQ